MIPKIIWQTYRARDLPPKAATACESWRQINPGWECLLYDDTDIEKFMHQEFNGELSRLFRLLPLGVMKADVWRYAVLFKYGGIYTDIDTTCLVPVERWELVGRALSVGLENKLHFCQWTIVATPGHPVLAEVLHLIEKRFQSGIDTTYEHFVHKHSGPGIWTDAIRKVLGLSDLTAKEIYDNHREAAAASGIQLLPQSSFHGSLVSHAFGSNHYHDGYARWTVERERFLSRELPQK
jgi:inositol phosphorylceramide mannosyltransferase catalytic subunit